MPLRLDYNPYRGINAHFHSWLQQGEGGWVTFHSDHITHLKSALNRILPEGYYAVSEQSLQILVSGTELTRTRPDIAIMQRGPLSHPAEATQPAMIPTLEVATEEILIDEDELTAVVIYADDQPVTRLELLSPSNKTSDRNHYLAMRRKTLNAGLRLVEIDYLHETPNLYTPLLPDYSRHEPDAYPYSIVIADPSPTPASPSGITRFYCLQVDEGLPTLAIPLMGTDAVGVDFGAVYQTTFEDDRRPSLLLDYSEPPVNFDTYAPIDQARIHEVMARVRETV
ncbi:MAG: DUF4058 family protein [Anaerolineales bacterium]|nr:DUF4058 family protein [Anaerolineales bacterium]